MAPLIATRVLLFMIMSTKNAVLEFRHSSVLFINIAIATSFIFQYSADSKLLLA
jgi:hypothetical protein